MILASSVAALLQTHLLITFIPQIPTRCEYFSNSLAKHTNRYSGAVVSLFTGGGFFGALAAGPLAVRVGRRITIVVGALCFILGGVLQAVAQNLSFLYSGRAIAGFGVGFMVMIVPLYQAEISHPSIRGRITGLQQLMLGIGAVVASELTFIDRFAKRR